MNDLITPGLSQLPALPVEEVKQTVDKVGAYVDALAAAKKATTDQNTINEIDEQIRKYSAFKIRCQMELGKRTAGIEKSNKWESSKSDARTLTKSDKLAELGISKQLGKVFDMRNLSEMSRRTGYPTETLRRWKNKPLSIKAVDLIRLEQKTGVK